MPVKNSTKRGKNLKQLFSLVALPVFILAGFFIFVANSQAAEPIDQNDLGIWHFNETAGITAYDSSNNHLDLAWGSNHWGGGRTYPERVGGRWDIGLNLNQNEEHMSIETESLIDVSDGLTIGSWIKTDLNSVDKSRFFWSGNTFNYAGTPANFFSLSVENGLLVLDIKSDGKIISLVSSQNVSDNNWHFISARLDQENGTLAIFIDGVESIGESIDFPIPAIGKVDIGWREDYFASRANNFRGAIDDVWLRKEALTNQELVDFYQSGQPYKSEAVLSPLAKADLVAHYAFDDSAGYIASDSSGNGYDLQWGTNHWGGGEPISRSVPGKFGNATNSKKVEDLFSRGFSPTISFSDGITVGVWARTNETSANTPATIVILGTSFNNANDPQNLFYISEYQGHVRVYLGIKDDYEYSITSNSLINDGQWHFYTMTIDPRPNSRVWKLFVDGNLEGEATMPKTIPDVNVIKIGWRYYYFCDSGCNFAGDIDDLFILSSSIPDEKVKQIFDSNKPYPDAQTRNPVIIVPGIIASYLNNAATGEEIWPNFIKMSMPGFDNYLDELTLNQFGENNENNPMVTSSDIFREIHFEILGKVLIDKDFFRGLIEELKNNGYEEDEDLFVFPYDWRFNLNLTSNDSTYLWQTTLKEKIEYVKGRANSEKVDIIAHSMGGLLVKDYIDKNIDNSIDKFIDIATPHLGSPKAFKILNYGDDLDINFLGIFKLNQQEIKDISQNMPSIYQILPSRKYFESNVYSISNAYIFDIVGGNQNVGILSPLDYDQSIAFLSDQGRNNFLLGVSGVNAVNINDELHSRIDNLPNIDNYYNIIGCGQATYAGVQKKNNKNWALSPLDGDGTVPLKSAKSFGIEAHKYYTNISEHANLPSADGVRQLAVSILQDKENDFDFSAYQSLSQDQEICGINGVNAGSHSPVELHIYDEEDNHTGPLPDGNIEKGIPGVSYDILGEDKYAFLPVGRNYHIVNQATSSGELGITLDKIENSQPTGFVYFASIPLNSASTTVEYNITDNQAEYQASIDFDGNGTVDEVVTPDSVLSGEQLNDLTAPQTTISILGQSGNDDYYISNTEISLEAADDNSGVLKTEFSLDGGNTWIEYSEEFFISQSGTTTILYSSTGRAGNREENKEEIIKIDKIAPEISVLLPQEDQEIFRNEKLEVEYFADDYFSGVATDTVKIYLDEQIVNSSTIDLFKQNLGAHQIKIIIQDLAGNQSEQIINFSVINDIDG
ncbi:MAG: LamG-like jellyroll fold domain-containing protein, partial [Patescibacteria group bacterium]